ncbi:MAG: TIGR03016 family PEP-CTERM system-associated outer membrane protein [Nitrospirales bacterium]|nr:TIGR03016 family PEP-CTERM system-associated outer membrane protein [Nitrospirales bacterium]
MCTQTEVPLGSKRHQYRTLLSLITVALIALFPPLSLQEAGAAEFEIHPAIMVIEEYNDNIFLTREDKVDDFITRAVPSLAFKYSAPLWTWDIAYALDYMHYAKGARGDDTTHNLIAKGSIELLKDRFFIKLNDDYGRVSLDVTRDLTKESSFVDQSDRNIFVANPYYVIRPAERTRITAGYIYSNTWYEDPRAVNKTDNVVYVEPSYDLTPRTTLSAGYRYTDDRNDETDYTKHDAYMGSRYEYADKSDVFFRVGNTWLNFKGAKRYSRLFWNAGVNHDFTPFTGTLLVSMDYSEDPLGALIRENTYLAGIRADLSRTKANLTLAVTEYKNAETRRTTTTKYGAGGTVRYELTPRTGGSFEFLAERLEEEDPDTHIRRYVLGVRFDYLLWKDFTVSLAYRYADSSSPREEDDEENTYRANRFFLELKKTF